MQTERDTISRRTLARSAAWSLPVVAMASAAPAAMASTGTGNVTITAACESLGEGSSAPKFTITVAGMTVAVDSTFTLTISPADRAEDVVRAVVITASGQIQPIPPTDGDYSTIEVKVRKSLPDPWVGDFGVSEYRASFDQVTIGLSTGTILDENGNPVAVSSSASKVMESAESPSGTFRGTCS